MLHVISILDDFVSFDAHELVKLVLFELLELEAPHDRIALIIALRLQHDRPVLLGIKSGVSLLLVALLLILDALFQDLFLETGQLSGQLDLLDQVSLVVLELDFVVSHGANAHGLQA